MRPKQENAGPAAKKQKEAIVQIQSPEYWVARQELPFSKEYIGLQIKVAREVSKKLKIPLSKVVNDYTTVFHPYVWPDTEGYLDVDSLSDEQLAEKMYEQEKLHSSKQPPTEYNDFHRFGCFSYMVHTGGTGKELKGRVDIHFSNAEFEETGPLEKEKIERRLLELKDMFTSIKREFPNATHVRGDSWLYNVKTYTRLFPESYTKEPLVDDSPGALVTGRTWGQFADNNLQLKKNLAEAFLQKVKELEEVTPESVRRAMPLQALIVTAPIEDFYKMYGVE